MLRQLDPEARYFACFDATSGFHQIRVDEESSKLMTIVTQYGTYRYTVLGQGICSSQDLFNWITDGGTKLDEDFQVLKNIDDFCLFGKTLEDLEIQIDKLAKFVLLVLMIFFFISTLFSKHNKNLQTKILKQNLNLVPSYVNVH